MLQVWWPPTPLLSSLCEGIVPLVRFRGIATSLHSYTELQLNISVSIAGAPVRSADQRERIQGSDNDVRIFQLVQECQLNRSPAEPSSLSIGVTSEATELPAVEEPPSAAVEVQKQSPENVPVDERVNEPSAPTVLKPKSQGDPLNHPSSPQDQCYSRATIKDTQSSGLPPIDTMHTGARPRGPADTHIHPLHHSEVCTVVDSQSGSGTGAEGVVPSRDGVEGGGLPAQAGNHSEPQQSSLNVVGHAAPATDHATAQRTQAAPNHGGEQGDLAVGAPDKGAAEPAAPPAGQQHGACSSAGAHADEDQQPPAEAAAANKGAEQCRTATGADEAAVEGQNMHPPEHLAHGQEPTNHTQHTQQTSDEEEAAEGEDKQRENELDSFLPTQIDGLEELLLPMHAAEPVAAAPDEPPLGAALCLF